MDNANKKGKRLKGTVISDTMAKTVVVVVTRFVRDPKYGKYLKRSKRFKAHDEGNVHKIGETVIIEECRPISKDKHFKVVSRI